MTAAVQDALDWTPRPPDLTPVIEVWRPVVGFDGLYEVSDHGQVRSLPRRWVVKGRVLQLLRSGHNGGYRKVGLSRPGVKVGRSVHVLVAAAFLGPRPTGHHVRHLNGHPSDNRLVNLAYGTPGENLLDSVRLGVHFWAKRDACAHGHPYTPENVKTVPSRPTVRYCRQCHRDNDRRARLGLVQNLRGPKPRLVAAIPPITR